MSLLPWPANPADIHKTLKEIDEHLLLGSEKFIRQQIAKPVNYLVSNPSACCDLSSQESFWLNVYSIFNANQQLNEACNKMWAAAELANITRDAIWKKKYVPIGPEFGGIFMTGTLIPTLYYAQISAMISILSSFGCIPILVRGTPFYFVRTKSGWRAIIRRHYIKTVFSKKIKGWHEQIIATYFGLIYRKVALPKLPAKKIAKLKDMRNEVHYNVLGDLKMWRVPKRHQAYGEFVPVVDRTIVASIAILNEIKKVTTKCDQRYATLRQALQSQLKLL